MNRITSGFGVFLEEVRDGFLCLESLIVFNKDGECVAPQRRHISIDGHWVGTCHGGLHKNVPSYIRKWELHTLVFESAIEGAESGLRRSVGLTVNVNVATGGPSLTLQHQLLGCRHKKEKHTHIATNTRD